MSLPARTQYTAALDTRCTAALTLCQRTSTTVPHRQCVPTAPQPSHQRRSGGVHGVAVEPCSTARHAQRNPRGCKLPRKSGLPDSFGNLPWLLSLPPKRTVGSKRPRPLCSKINFLHGTQANNYVFYENFEGFPMFTILNSQSPPRPIDYRIVQSLTTSNAPLHNPQ